MFKKLTSLFSGDPTGKLVNSLSPIVTAVAAQESKLQQMSPEELRAQTALLKERYEQGESLDDLLEEAFALVREASIHTTGLRHYDVQIMGGVLLHQHNVVEMRTGEGKTLVATLPLYLNALTGRGVHLVTVNEYLARRDGGWMGKIFHFLGLTVGVIGPLGFSALYDPDYVNPGAELEDERLVHWRPCTRQQAYKADITYGISSEFGFDYLRDNMARDMTQLVQRELHYAVIDEVDNVLIDEARTPLIISGPASESGKDYERFAQYVRNLRRNTADEEEEANGHYDIDEKSRSISLTDMGIAEIEKRIPEIDVDAGDSLYDPQYYHLTYYLDNALRAQYMYKRDVQYVVQEGQVLIVDDFTGRLMPGRRYSDGLHEAIEAKEGVTIKRETVTVATITLQNYFRLYDKLAGMTGTAVTDAEEFDTIYELGVAPLPTNVEHIVTTGSIKLETKKEKREGAEAITYLDPDTGKPRFFKRTDFPDQIYGTEAGKDQAIIAQVKQFYEKGCPVLVGTTSVEHSETIHNLLKKENITHKILNAKIHQSEALIIAQAGRKGAVTISTNMAGRGTDILLGGNPEGLAAEKIGAVLFDRLMLEKLATTLSREGEEKARYLAQKNDKLHESLVDELLHLKADFDEAMAKIERLGMLDYVAGTLQEPYAIDFNDARKIVRLVRDGQFSEAREEVEELGKDVAVVDRATHQWHIYMDYQSIHANDQEKFLFVAGRLFEQHYNARASIIRAVLGGARTEAEEIVMQVPGIGIDLITMIEEIQQKTASERYEVWELGGLHVIGSERHESRRIDNQLRGRAARQGDPGSSRFFLSLEDDLMKRFGGERLKNFMARTNIPKDTPIENGVLDRLIAGSQERLEGYNFDMRKNVVEYDDVMNKQRQAIYSERQAILLGEEIDLDEKIEQAFANTISELVDNYVTNYHNFVRGEIERAITSFTTEATDVINVSGVLRQARRLLPKVMELDREELEGLRGNRLADRLISLAYENEEEGINLYQLLQAMGRFLPLLPLVPNLGGLTARRSGQLQARDNARRDYITQVEMLFQEFLAAHIEAEKRAEIWETAVFEIDQAFTQFKIEGLSTKNATAQQFRFRAHAEEAVRNLLLESLATLESDALIIALNEYVKKQQEKWREQIGIDEYRVFQRQLLLAAIDREWRDYLTAMDDLRREVGLEAVGQRDPKVEYKRRSYAMFADMRHNIEKEIGDRFFRQVAGHQEFVHKQQAEQAYQIQARDAGYQVVKRSQGKGVELRRDIKVGRNDPCPCGSGKKYKHCHMRADEAAAGGNGQAQGTSGTAKKQKRIRRR